MIKKKKKWLLINSVIVVWGKWKKMIIFAVK